MTAAAVQARRRTPTELCSAEGDGAAKAVVAEKAVVSSVGVVPQSSVGVRDESRLRALGIASSSAPFRCVLPGHGHPARIHPDKTGSFSLYVCPSWSGGLAEVRASVAYREPRNLRAVEAARWNDRLDRDAGVRVPILIDGELPNGIGKSACIVLEHMWLLVGLRELPEPGEDPPRRFPLTEPFTFARPFGPAYTGLTDDAFRHGMRSLKDSGVIYPVNERERKHLHPIQWKLAAQDGPLPLAHAALAGGLS